MTARKGVTAWEIEPMEENGDEFFVLTFHHGLGEMTRLDLGADDVQDIAHMLMNASGQHLPDGYVDAGFICDACTADAAAEDATD